MSLVCDRYTQVDTHVIQVYTYMKLHMYLYTCNAAVETLGLSIQGEKY